MFRERQHETICPWRSRAAFFDLVPKNEELETCAWSYRTPGNSVLGIKGWVAFDSISLM